MGELVAQWYGLLNTLNSVLNEPIRELSVTAGIPPLTAILLGLLGALSPCQISTGLGAVALIGRRVEGRPLLAGLAYVAGKATVYALLGLAVVLLGQAAASSSIPLIQIVRRALGPLMLLVGLVLLGVWRAGFAFGLGDRVAVLATERLDASRPLGAYALGAAFGLAFCPTLFFLFFGLLIPLALVSPGGIAYPALFAVGTTLPVLAILAALAFGAGGSTAAAGLAARAQPFLTRLAGFILVIAGANDTIVYWSL